MRVCLYVSVSFIWLIYCDNPYNVFRSHSVRRSWQRGKRAATTQQELQSHPDCCEEYVLYYIYAMLCFIYEFTIVSIFSKNLQITNVYYRIIKQRCMCFV